MLAHLKVLMAVVVCSTALAAAGDIDSTKGAQVDSKWYYGGGWGANYGLGLWSPWINNYWGLGSYYGFGYLPYGFNSWWFKSLDAASVNKRRSLQFDTLAARGDGNSEVSCKNSKGQTERFTHHDCHKAAKKMAENKLSTASCGTCTLTLRGAQGELTVNKVPSSELKRVASEILQACASPNSVPNLDGNTAASTENKAAGLFLSKGTGQSCH